MTDTPGVPGQHQGGQPRPGRASERTIPATCQYHGRCNLRVTRRADGGIVLDPHVQCGSCVITLHVGGGAALRDLLIEWQGWEGTR